MKNLFIFILFSFIALKGATQITLDKVKHNFGDLEPYSARYVDFILTNQGDKQEWLLRIVKPNEVTYINSKQFIEKDSTIVIRLHVNPKKKGRFNYKIDVYLSDRAESIELKLSGIYWK